VHKLIKDWSTRHCRKSFAGITRIANRWLIRSRCKSATVELAWKGKEISVLTPKGILFYCHKELTSFWIASLSALLDEVHSVLM
jgi:hypothetical protein